MPIDIDSLRIRRCKSRVNVVHHAAVASINADFGLALRPAIYGCVTGNLPPCAGMAAMARSERDLLGLHIAFQWIRGE